MGKHILFLVHGMGSYGAFKDGKWVQDTKGWFAEARKSLVEVYDTFIKNDPKLGKGVDFDDRFVVETIEFDSFLERYRTDWEYQAGTWKAFDLDDGVAGKITDFFKGNTDKSFLWTHVADVLLYTSPLLQDAIHPHVARQILEALRKHHQALRLDNWSILAHSLGTAVINNAIPALMAEAKQDPELDAALIPPKVIGMVANVARALSPPAAAYSDRLVPDGPLNVGHYLNCSHTLDPFCRIRPFQPSDPKWVKAAGYVPLTGLSGYYLADEFIDWVQDWNNFDKLASVVPHGFSHYMRQPRVVAELWPRLRGRRPSESPDLESTVREANEKLVRETVGDHLRQKLQQEVRQRLEGALGDMALPTTKEEVAKLLPTLLGKLKGF